MRIDQESMQTFRIGDCPACRYPIWAEVDLGVKIGVPYLESDGSAKVFVEALKRGMRLHHECRDEDGNGRPEPYTAPLTAEQPSADHGDGSGAGGGAEGEGAA